MSVHFLARSTPVGNHAHAHMRDTHKQASQASKTPTNSKVLSVFPRRRCRKPIAWPVGAITAHIEGLTPSRTKRLLQGSEDVGHLPPLQISAWYYLRPCHRRKGFPKVFLVRHGSGWSRTRNGCEASLEIWGQSKRVLPGFTFFNELPSASFPMMGGGSQQREQQSNISSYVRFSFERSAIFSAPTDNEAGGRSISHQGHCNARQSRAPARAPQQENGLLQVFIIPPN